MKSRDGWLSCHTCVGYERRRLDDPALVVAIAEQAELEDVSPNVIFARLMRGVHARHHAGLAVLP